MGDFAGDMTIAIPSEDAIAPVALSPQGAMVGAALAVLGGGFSLAALGSELAGYGITIALTGSIEGAVAELAAASTVFGVAEVTAATVFGGVAVAGVGITMLGLGAVISGYAIAEALSVNVQPSLTPTETIPDMPMTAPMIEITLIQTITLPLKEATPIESTIFTGVGPFGGGAFSAGGYTITNAGTFSSLTGSMVSPTGDSGSGSSGGASPGAPGPGDGPGPGGQAGVTE